MTKQENKNGWIKLHRQILENPIAQKPCYLALWVYLLIKANHKSKDFIWNGKRQTCKRGQVLTGRNEIARETGIKAGTVENILKYLEIEQQIEQQKTSKHRLITVINYNQYQSVEQEIEQQSDNRVTTDEQQNDTTKNDKNNKNVKNDKNKHMDFVMLTEEEYEKLVKAYPHTIQSYIERLNNYIGSTGTKYKSHYFTLLNWIKRDKDNPPKAPFRSDSPQILKYNPPTNV